MSALRSLVFLLFQCVVTPAYAFAMVALFWLPRVPMFGMAASWCRVNLWGARWICGIRYRMLGAENIPTTPHIVLSKHSSTWETLALTMFFPPLAFVAKKELLSIPFFGWGFALASPITIDRKAGTDAMHQIAAQGRERFRQGFWIVLYPEGTRIRAGRRSKYKTGGARLAIELGVPVLPVAHNAGYLWPRGVFGKLPGTITVSIGKPIPPETKDAQTLMQEAEAWIEAEVERLGRPDGIAA
ncbi:MAG: lysophospholipid acyltransferase family protein [Betaproteobacteria bacterium]